MSQNTVFPDWRKQAAAQLNDEDVEVAFMRQAFTYVESKGRPLLQEPYFIGFEVVDKNDANTNMVGLFVFRLDKTLLYAPVFFKNGDIKGANLLYDSRLKLFAPLAPEWCNYHVGREAQEGGTLVSQNHNNVKGRGIDFDNIKVPETLRKSASAQTLRDWEDMQKEAAKVEKLLPKLLKTEQGAEAFEKIASAVEKDFTFASAMNEVYQPEEWLDIEVGHKKQAAVTEPETLIIHIGEFNPNADVPADQQFGYGASFKDTRSAKAEVYEDREDTGEEITETGVYRVIDRSGDWKNLLVVVNPERAYGPCPSACCEDGGYYGSVYKNPLSTNNLAEAGYDMSAHKRTSGKQNVMIFDLDSKLADYQNGVDLFGNLDEKDMEAVTTPVSALKKGDHVHLIDGCYVTDEPVEVLSKRTEDGITTIKAENDFGGEREYVINDEVAEHKSDIDVWSKHTRAFKVKPPVKEDDYKHYKCLDFRPGDINTISEFLCHNGVKRASVQRVPNRNRFVVRCNGQITPELNKYAAAAQLAHGLRIDGNSALDLIKEASELGERKFLVKSARISLQEPLPEKLLTTDSEFGVMQDEPESYTIDAESDAPQAPTSRTGDQYTMDGMQVIIETGTPDELYQASQSIQDDSIFDMGVVGSLVKTFDAAEMVEQYIPDLRQGLDKLGRILFLMYWKPEDFVDAYGTDDMSDMENKLLSSFKQFGDLILDLMQQFKFEDKVDMNSLTGK